MGNQRIAIEKSYNEYIMLHYKMKKQFCFVFYEKKGKFYSVRKDILF